MPYYNEGTLTTDIREVAIDTTWDTQTDWEAYQSANQVAISNGVVSIEEYTTPPSGISRFNFEQSLADEWDGNDGTENGTVTYNTNSQEGEYSVEMGASDYVSLGMNDMPTGDSPISVLMWVQTSDSDDVVWAYGSPNSSEAVGINTSGVFLWGRSMSGPSFHDGSWHQVGLRYQSGDMDMILDGAATDEFSDTANLTQGNHYLGMNINNQGGAGIQADNLQIFNKFVSDSEIQNYYNTGSILG